MQQIFAVYVVSAPCSVSLSVIGPWSESIGDPCSKLLWKGALGVHWIMTLKKFLPSDSHQVEQNVRNSFGYFTIISGQHWSSMAQSNTIYPMCLGTYTILVRIYLSPFMEFEIKYGISECVCVYIHSICIYSDSTHSCIVGKLGARF